MYVAIVILLMFLLPLGSMEMEHLRAPGAASWMMLAGKWFVFWSAGIRFLTAGLWQYLRPRFTAVKIFRMKTEEALPIIRELGISNFAVGVAGVASLSVPSFVVPVALIAAIYLGVAGARHAAAKTRNINENVALVSAFWVAAVLVAFLIHLRA